MSNLKTLPAAEPAGWYVRTKVTADDREGLILANFGSPEPCHFALFEQGEILAAVASEAINATRETGVGPAEMRRQRDELLAELKDVVKYAREDRAQTPGFTRLARALIRADAAIARAEGKS